MGHWQILKMVILHTQNIYLLELILSSSGSIIFLRSSFQWGVSELMKKWEATEILLFVTSEVLLVILMMQSKWRTALLMRKEKILNLGYFKFFFFGLNKTKFKYFIFSNRNSYFLYSFLGGLLQDILRIYLAK